MGLSLRFFFNADTGSNEEFECDVKTFYITHNLTMMAKSAKLYDPLWNPLAVEARNMAKNGRTVIKPIVILPLLENGFKTLVANKEHMKKFENPNGFGTYEDLLNKVGNIIKLIEKYPNTLLEVEK